MAKKTKKETGKDPGMDKAKVAMYVSMAIEDLKKAVKENSAVRQSRVYEALEQQIGTARTRKIWPEICKTARGDNQ